MSRRARLLVDGGVYHIINRGHDRHKIFHEPVDYNEFKEAIRSYKNRFAFELFHYCLMPNHIHLLLRISIGQDLPNLMQGITQKYEKYHKRKYKLVGNLFQGRYKSLYIDKDTYLLECGRYIERNPLRANMVKNMAECQFSSFNFYAIGKADDIITANPLYCEMSQDPKERMKLYVDYLMQERPYERIVDREFQVGG